MVTGVVPRVALKDFQGTIRPKFSGRNLLMMRNAISLTILSFLVVSLTQVASSQQSHSVAGKWDVTIRMSGKNVVEQWTIQQNGDDVTATIKRADGELKIMCELNNTVFRADFKDEAGMLNKVRAAISSDRMDGSLTVGDKQEYLWAAKRSKSL